MKIIGGPALRRTEPKAVYIWVVLDTKADSIEAFATTTHGKRTESTIGVCTKASKRPVQLGDSLFVYLLKLRSTDSSYPWDTKIFYNIIVNGISIRSATLFYNPGPQSQILTYRTDKLPSFFLPTKHRRILQASCRKPHAGIGNLSPFDMMSKADELLNDSLDRLGNRPSMLFLTGDQIYADDVSAPLLAGLTGLANIYTGWNEIMPHPKGSGRNVIPAQLKLGQRYTKLHKKRGFSSGKKDHHLMSFGEYMTMYLVVWGGLPADMPTYETILNRIPVVEKRVGKWKKRSRKIGYEKYESERSYVEQFLNSTWKMRRLMANIPTYMIFDDHEVTDDWNLTKNNQVGLRKTGTLGRRLQANALAAYWACQGWGNAPSHFDSAFGKTLTKFLLSKRVTDGNEFENTLLSRNWDYQVDGYPIIVALDTRTQREFKKSESFSRLMKYSAIKSLQEKIISIGSQYKGDRDQQSIVIVSAAPVLGFTALERLQLGASFIPRTVDGEPWIGSSVAYRHLKNALRKVIFEDCVILSGDVHYAFARRLMLKKGSTDSIVRVSQFTSSAVHNAPDGMKRFFLDALEKKDLRNFNRKQSPYLFPENRKDKDFINGDNNLGLLELKNGRPVRNTYYFYDSTKNHPYQWTYSFGKPQEVHFA